MKKLLSIILVMILLFLTSCGTAKPEAADKERTEHYEDICVDIGVNEDGYYGTYADVDINYYDGAVSWIYVKDPTLLAFNVSSEYENGVFIMSGTEGDSLVKVLKETVEAAEAAGNNELATEIYAALEILYRSGPFKQAST